MNFSLQNRIFLSVLITPAKYQLFSALILMDHTGCMESGEEKEEIMNMEENKRPSRVSKFVALLCSPSTTIPKELPAHTFTPVRNSMRSRFMLTSLSSHSIVTKKESLVYF